MNIYIYEHIRTYLNIFDNIYIHIYLYILYKMVVYNRIAGASIIHNSALAFCKSYKRFR